MLFMLAAINSQSNDRILRNNDLFCFHSNSNLEKQINSFVGVYDLLKTLTNKTMKMQYVLLK